MSLKESKVIYLDAQTTGMRPPAAQLLELAWSVDRGGDSDPAPVIAHLVALPAGASIPYRVSEITGIRDADLAQATAREDLVQPLMQAFSSAEAFVIHYAQFEKPFLCDLLSASELPRPVLCTHQLVKRLFPNLPSQNIRATAGFFGPPVVGHNRAGVFVRATAQIWRGLVTELETRGLTSVDAVIAWLKETPRAKSTRYEYRLDKVKRLELPDSPGIYRMLGKNGDVLYVGKATSLRSRVNSYFRGKKGRDQRKLEMLAQVWDLQVTACPTPLEAALLESDEIKRLNPPYNVVLKTGRRHLLFYARDFGKASREQSAAHPIGPYRNTNWITHLQMLVQSLATGEFIETLFYEPLPADDLRRAFELFRERHPVGAYQTVRQFLAYGLKLYREFEEPLDQEIADLPESTDDAEPKALTVDEIAGKFERLLRRAGAEYWRTRRMTKLLNARVRIGERQLEFRRGQMLSAATDAPSDAPTPEAPTSEAPPWNGLQIDTYDRMSILLAELDRLGQRIEPP